MKNGTAMEGVIDQDKISRLYYDKNAISQKNSGRFLEGNENLAPKM